MLTIRLQRVGRKNDPSFRVVVIESRYAAKSGKALEILGSYNARVGTPVLKGERILHWVKQGAQVSDNMHNILVNAGLIQGKKRNVNPKKTVAPKEVEAPAQQAATPVQADAPTTEAPVVAEAEKTEEAAGEQVTA